MLKFNKVFNFKIASLAVICVFLFNYTAYGIDLPQKSFLRKPLDFNDPKTASRYLSTLSLIAEENRGGSNSLTTMPVFDKITKSILDSLSPDRNVIVNIQSNFESKDVMTTVADALALKKDKTIVSIAVKRIPPVTANTVPVEGVANKFETDWLTQWDDDAVLGVMVQFASGQTAAFYGNKEMLLELANQPDVMRVMPSEAPQWMRIVYEIPQEERVANADWLGKLASSFGSGVVMTSQEANIAGMEVYHGTIASLRDSVKAGPKNIGKGLGGRGLYLAVQGERDIAEYFAKFAAIEHRDTADYLSGEVAVNQNAGRKLVILTGKINPERQLRVGKFTVKREVGMPDLINGVLPALWDNDPNLRALFEKEFDVLDLWGMHSSGLAIDTDHMLIVHERAGDDAIIWQDSSINREPEALLVDGLTQYKENIKEPLAILEEKLRIKFKEEGKIDSPELNKTLLRFSGYESRILPAYYELMKAVDEYLTLRNKGGFIYIYPFSGPDRILNMVGKNTFFINLERWDSDDGFNILERAFSSDMISQAQSNLDTEEKSLDAMDYKTWDKVAKLKNVSKTVIIKGFFSYAREKYPQASVEPLLSYIFNNILQKGDRILILNKNDIGAEKIAEEAGFSVIGPKEASFFPYRGVFTERTKLFLIPSAFILLEKREISKEIGNSFSINKSVLQSL